MFGESFDRIENEPGARSMITMRIAAPRHQNRARRERAQELCNRARSAPRPASLSISGTAESTQSRKCACDASTRRLASAAKSSRLRIIATRSGGKRSERGCEADPSVTTTTSTEIARWRNAAMVPPQASDSSSGCGAKTTVVLSSSTGSAAERTFARSWNGTTDGEAVAVFPFIRGKHPCGTADYDVPADA